MKKYINKKTGEIVFAEQDFSYGPPNAYWVESHDRSFGLSRQKLVERYDLYKGTTSPSVRVLNRINRLNGK